jgi:hypothetical protein
MKRGPRNGSVTGLPQMVAFGTRTNARAFVAGIAIRNDGSAAHRTPG